MTKNYEQLCRRDGIPGESSEAAAAAAGIESMRLAQAFARIRDDLVHGYHPRRADLLLLWKSATGEVIHDGRRCSVCNGNGLARYGSSGSSGSPNPEVRDPESQPCRACGGLGWDALPTAWEQISEDRD